MRLIGWAVFLSALALLLWLGTWQVQRGQAKADMLAERAAARQAEALPLPGDDVSAESLYGRAVEARGRYDGERQILLDNQVWRGRVGFRVWTPLRLTGGRLVLVDRGWVPPGPDRSHPPRPTAPDREVTVRGLWRDWPRPGIRMDAPDVCAQEGWPRMLNYPSYEQVACQYEAPVVDGLLLLAEDLPGGFARDWNDLGPPPLRHYGYAAQWYALALALAVLFVVLNLRRKDDGSQG